MSLATGVFWLGLLISPAYLWLTDRPPSLWRSVIKIVPLSLFAIAAWLAGAPAVLVLALAFSVFGDLALSRSGQTAFLLGLGGFALAHVMFILLFRSLGAEMPWQAFALQPVPAVALLILAVSSEWWLSPYCGEMRGPVRIYVVLITLMGLFAFALPGALYLVALGAGLFILSDFILAIRLFRLTDDSAMARPASWALWVAYIAGQAVITLVGSAL